MLTPALLTVSPGYPTASYPWGRPVHPRTVWHVSTVARHTPPRSIFPSLPVSAWTVTRYDDRPRMYHVRHESDHSKAHFTAPSLRKALVRLEASLSPV